MKKQQSHGYYKYMRKKRRGKEVEYKSASFKNQADQILKHLAFLSEARNTRDTT